jgi:hypothetical protein
MAPCFNHSQTEQSAGLSRLFSVDTAGYSCGGGRWRPGRVQGHDNATGRSQDHQPGPRHAECRGSTYNALLDASPVDDGTDECGADLVIGTDIPSGHHFERDG